MTCDSVGQLLTRSMLKVQGSEAAAQAQTQPSPDLHLQGVRGTGTRISSHFDSI